MLTSQTTSPTKGKKRHSTDGDTDASFDKKSKENEGENAEPIFQHRQMSDMDYVVPSSAGCTPRKVNCGKSLSVISTCLLLYIYELVILVTLTVEIVNVNWHTV